MSSFIVLSEGAGFSLGSSYVYEMKRVTESGQQGIKTGRSFLLYSDPWWTQHQLGINPKKSQCGERYLVCRLLGL